MISRLKFKVNHSGLSAYTLRITSTPNPFLNQDLHHLTFFFREHMLPCFWGLSLDELSFFFQPQRRQNKNKGGGITLETRYFFYPCLFLIRESFGGPFPDD